MHQTYLCATFRNRHFNNHLLSSINWQYLHQYRKINDNSCDHVLSYHSSDWPGVFHDAVSEIQDNNKLHTLHNSYNYRNYQIHTTGFNERPTKSIYPISTSYLYPFIDIVRHFKLIHGRSYSWNHWDQKSLGTSRLIHKQLWQTIRMQGDSRCSWRRYSSVQTRVNSILKRHLLKHHSFIEEGEPK